MTLALAPAHVVIAARGGPEAKSRCAVALPAADRAELTAVMLEDMLSALAGAPGLAQVWVVTPTPDLAERATALGAQVIRQSGAPGLNAAFRLGLDHVADQAAYAAVALLPGDLPLLKANDLQAALLLTLSHALVLAPALDGGTGLLALRAGTSLEPAFGPHSFQRHAQAAKALALSAAVIAADGLAQDVDRVEDLRRVIDQAPASRTAAFLRERLQPRIGS